MIKLADKYQMDNISQLATHYLEEFQNPLHMFLASRLYGAEEELLVPALRAFSLRGPDLSVGESKILNSQDVLLIMTTRNAVQDVLRQGFSDDLKESYLDSYFDDIQRNKPIYDAHFTDFDLEPIMRAGPP